MFAGEHISHSANDYDWLGEGSYFWENSPERALSYAQHLKRWSHRGKGSVKEPFVVGAIIDLGLCLNLTDEGALLELEEAHQLLIATSAILPINHPGFTGDQDNLKRHLDCAIFQTLHQARDIVGLPPYASIRSPFLEGPPLFVGAGFRKQTHIQVCVRNVRCIKGYFRPLNSDGSLFQK